MLLPCVACLSNVPTKQRFGQHVAESGFSGALMAMHLRHNFELEMSMHVALNVLGQGRLLESPSK